ncbi:MAG: hypothetical protein KA004_11935, partial [Verrucomicrobiales bacterium]|nr:hypothetical protein [Verrucomicrobiales bacterium]
MDDSIEYIPGREIRAERDQRRRSGSSQEKPTLVRRILMRLAARGVERVVIGTMHRGRLNILTNALDRPLALT